jgi:hypothetical protein
MNSFAVATVRHYSSDSSTCEHLYMACRRIDIDLLMFVRVEERYGRNVNAMLKSALGVAARAGLWDIVR